jgi:hypothetical protein
MSNIIQSQTSIVEALLQQQAEGFTFTCEELCDMEPRLRRNATAAYLGLQRKKGRLELVSRWGNTYNWRLPREFFEIPYRVRQTPSPGGNGSHPGKRIAKEVPQLKPAKVYQKKKKTVVLPTVKTVKPRFTEELLALALRAERGESVAEQLLALALREMRGE